MTDDSTLPRIARYKPFYAELSKGKTYYWCACGLSKKQPYCDGSHRGTGFQPIPYQAETEGQEVLFCGCKHSGGQPFCDGSHNNLRDEYDTDDPQSEANRAIGVIQRASDGRTRLDGDCFVAEVNSLPGSNVGHLEVKKVISAADGAQHQSQFFFRFSGDQCPNVRFRGSDVLLFVWAGHGQVNIGGRHFRIDPLSGAHVRPGEAFSFLRSDEEDLQIYVSVCPSTDGPEWVDQMPTGFDNEFPERVVRFDEQGRTAMADRFFQILVGKQTGCSTATQFIGEIPQSKAAVHRHLYEESLVIVSGHGCMWTHTARTPVGPGDVIFLPRKEGHSLECTSPGGMLVAGVIYPGDNPSINY